MHSLKIERRKVSANSSLSAAIAQHLSTQPSPGKVCVVTDKPKDMMPAVRKQWLKVIRQTYKQRAGTLKATEILKHTQQIAHMQRMYFEANPANDFVGVDVGFVTPAQVLGYAPECRTMYIACNVQKDKLHFMTAMMPPDGTVIIYDAS